MNDIEKQNKAEVAATKPKRNLMDIVKSTLSILFIILVTFQIGVVVGWNMRTADYGRTQSEANAIVKTISKTSEQK